MIHFLQLAGPCAVAKEVFRKIELFDEAHARSFQFSVKKTDYCASVEPAAFVAKNESCLISLVTNEKYAKIVEC